MRDDTLSARHAPSGIEPDILSGSPPFSEYIERSRDFIRQARLASGRPASDKVIEGNSPFESTPDRPDGQDDKPYRRGILLTHGLSDSPYQIRALGKFFQAQGFRVMAVRLPGHGTQPGDLLSVRWPAWMQTVRYGCAQLAAEVDELYLGGFSAGATLSVLQSRNDLRVRGLFLFAPALKLPLKAQLARFHHFYDGFFPRAAWVGIAPDEDNYKYESFPKNAVVQMLALLRALPPKPASTLPVFAAASADDTTVDARATLRFLCAVDHPCKHLVWYAREPAACPSGLNPAQFDWVQSALPERQILGSAHTAITLPDDDPHYGASGDYVNCLHYFPQDDARYQACKRAGAECPRGEVTPQNLHAGLMRRLTFNPHFSDMCLTMQRFIHSLP